MRLTVLFFLMIVLVFPFVAGSVSGQIPDQFENLEVLPKDISKGELIGVMKDFTGALGVRCHYCHVGEEGLPLSEFDFVSDQKAAKEAARVMLTMVTEINQGFLTKLGEKTGSGLTVECVTCHHGQVKPRLIEDILEQRYSAHGIQAAVQKYQSLRKEYYGGFQYDFSEGMLTVVAQRIMKSGKYDDALTILQLNLEFHPGSVATYSAISDGYLKKGETGKAVEALKSAIELDPEGPWAPWLKKRLGELETEE